MAKYFAHPTAIIETENIGEGTRIWAFAHVLRGASIGANCNIGDHTFIEGGAVIGDDVTVKNNCLIWEGVTIEDGAFIGPGVIFTNDLHPRSPRLESARERYSKKENWLVKTRVERGASLGAGAVIVAGITIGEFAMVAAGAVATKDAPDYALLRGNPARQVGWVCECGQGLGPSHQVANEEMKCTTCGRGYFISNASLRRDRR